tara:strand:+ start:9577 stop:10890 length:1314 start_codon:yes stop_codon:yes gene_type:complete
LLLNRNKLSIFNDILKGSSTTFLISVLTIISGYLFIYFINKIYGTAFVGVFTTTQSLFFIISILCTLGFDTYSLKVFSSNNNINYLLSVYSVIIKTTLLLSVVISFILYFNSNLISFFFNNDLLSHPIKILSLSLIPLVILNIHSQIFRAFKNMYLHSIYNRKFIIVIMFFLILILLIFNWDINSNNIFYLYLYSMFFLAIISSLHIDIFLKKKKKENSKQDLVFEKENFSNLYSNSKSMLIISLVFILFQYIDILLLAFLSTDENVGIYTIVLKISSITGIVLMAINSIAGPIISKLYFNDKLSEFSVYIKKMVRLSFIFSIPILLFIIFFSSLILSFFGEQFNNYKYALIIMCLAQLINVSSGSVGLIMQMTNNEKIFRNIIVFSMVINFILNIILIPKFHVWGAIYSSSFSLVLWNVLGAFFVYKKLKIYSFIH